MGCSVIVTETVVTEYVFDSEEEARKFVDDGDFFILGGDVIDGEVLDVEIAPNHR